MGKRQCDEYRQVSFTVSMPRRQAAGVCRSIAIVTSGNTDWKEILKEAAAKKDVGWSRHMDKPPMNHEDVFPSHAARKEDKDLALDICRRVAGLLVLHDLQGKATVAQTAAELGRIARAKMDELLFEAADEGLHVHIKGEWASVTVLADCLMAIQDRFALDSIHFEYSEYERGADSEHGGGAVYIQPGKNPKYFDTAEWVMECKQAEAKQADDEAEEPARAFRLP